MSKDDKIKGFYKDLFDDNVNEKFNEDLDALKDEVEELKEKNNLKAKEWLSTNNNDVEFNISFSF